MRLFRLIVSLAIVTLFTLPTSGAVMAAEIPVANAGFEERVGAGGEVAGWPEIFGDARVGREITLSDQRAADGEQSVRIEDPSAERSVGLRSARLPASPGAVYSASVQVYNQSGGAQLYLEFWNEKGERIDRAYTGSTAANKWTQVTVQRLAPPGTVALTLLLYSHIANQGISFYDGVRLQTVPEGTPGLSVPSLSFDLSQAPILVPELGELRRRIPAGHPRLFARPETVAALREKRERSPIASLIWRNLRAKADSMAWNSALPPEPPDAQPGGQLEIAAWREGISIATDVVNRLDTLGFAYLMTGDARYGEAGKRVLLHVARWDPDGASSRSRNDEISMRLLYTMSRAYDWLYPVLSPEERALVQATMRERGNDVYVHMRSRHFEDRLLDNHLVRTMGFLGQAAIAFMGDFTEAEVWFDYIVLLFVLKYPPWGGDEGGWSQGVSYWQSYVSWVLEFVDALKIATGLDLYQKAFFRNTGYFKLYAHPPKSKFGAFGDHSDVPPDEGAARVMGWLATVYQEPAFQWYASQISGMGPVPVLPLDGFLGYIRAPDGLQAGLPPAPELPEDFPPSRVFGDVGWALMNVDMGDWENNVHVKFKSSPYGSFNHSHAEQNSFIIEAYGSPLAISSGYYPWYGSPHHKTWTWESRSKNTILVDGRGQGVQSLDARGRIVTSTLGGMFDYVLGDATQAYQGRLERFWRHLWFIKPNVILIFDQLETDHPATFDWLLHTPKEMEIDANQGRVRVPGETAEMWISFVTPAQLAFSQTGQFSVPPEEREANKPRQWHLTARSQSPDGVGRFLAVLVPRPATAASEPPPVVRQVAAKNGYGAEVRSGEESYTIAFRDGNRGPLQVAGLSTDAAALAAWSGGETMGFMTLGARVVEREGKPILQAGAPVDAGVAWRCQANEGQLALQLATPAGDASLRLAAECAPERVFVNNVELPREEWALLDGSVIIRQSTRVNPE